ncbi:MAG: glycosyltransferase family 2 protein [gamma proteobacterium symbiont of Taylorina sp.]|nr:glycosyltransferase family 2 protein [gamma proteobacterium symbiont of Taylorina sp.]
MKFSIIIPTYNYGHLISRAINSIPDNKNIEIIIIDDGSTDDTRHIVEQLSQQRNNVHYTLKNNSGAASARNKGIETSTGDYILFLDADDELLPDLFTEISNLVTVNTELLIGGHLSIESASSNNKAKIKQHLTHPVPDKKNADKPNEKFDQFYAYLKKEIPIMHGAFIVKKEIMQKYHYHEDFKSGEDIPVFAHLIASCKITFSEKIFLKLNKHNDSLRHNPEHAIAAGLKIVDCIFDKTILSEKMMRLKDWYFAKRCLSLFRTCYLSNNCYQARQYYFMAIKKQPACIFKLSYLRKFIRCLF